MTQNTRALVVLSGGQDSTTCLGWALANFIDVGCLTFNYGQRHAREIEAAGAVVDYFRKCYPGRDIPHETITFPAGILAGTSPLTNPAEELETYTTHDEMAAIIGDRVEKTFVPMRNALFLVAAANRAVVGNYTSLVTGVCEADNANYPDCRESFVDAMETAINEAIGKRFDDEDTEGYVQLVAPLMRMSKAASVRFALGIPYTFTALSFSHTAYDGSYPPTSKDHASVLRAHGFEQADRPDPLVLRAVWEGLMPVPETPNYCPNNVHGFTAAMFGYWGPPGA